MVISFAFLLTIFLKVLQSQGGRAKSSLMRRRWKSFFLILEFIKILFDIFETKAVKLIFSLNQLWLISLWISDSDTTFLLSKLSLVPTHS